MTKKAFFELLDKALEGLSVENKEKEINWIISRKYLEAYKKKITKGMSKCPLCEKYYPSKLELESKFVMEKENFTYTDGGYGDDDFTETFESLVEYHKCPNCKKFFAFYKY